jgi:hypothetical protein
MDSYVGRAVRYVLMGIVILAMGRLAWQHKNDAWIQTLFRPDGPAKMVIQFDNGSVRDAGTLPGGKPAESAGNTAQENTPGKLKKCLKGNEVIYTDNLCPVGTKVAAVDGGNVTVLGGSPPKPKVSGASHDGPKSLRDALDLSGNENIKDKMMERAINK